MSIQLYTVKPVYNELDYNEFPLIISTSFSPIASFKYDDILLDDFKIWQQFNYYFVFL